MEKEMRCYLIHSVDKPWINSWVGKISWRRVRLPTPVFLDFPSDSDGKESAYNSGDLGSIPGFGRSLKGRTWQPSPVFLPGESPWTEKPGWLLSMGHKVLDMTE